MSSKTCKSDILPTPLLKAVLGVVVNPLTKIVNFSLENGMFANEWKKAIIRPLIKKHGVDLHLSNYRPVSHLPFLSKVVEKVEVLGNEYGLGEMSLEWFANYLSDRQCCVNINGSLSSSKRLDFSVPQGSLSGPVLYSVYSSTLRYVIPDSFQLHGYADDHAIKQSHKPTFDEANTVRNEISTTMRDVKVWMDQNRLKLNETKTEYMQVGSKKLLSKCALDSICINNTTVNSSNCVKYLGTYLDSHLTLKTHIAAKCRAAIAGLRLVRNIRHLLTKDACHTIVLGLVISHLDYANSLYANLPNVVIMMLQRIQNMAAKLVLKRGKEDALASHQTKNSAQNINAGL
ncbi:reverse transcriptase [Apostichopus japonicus]|uniref:Reverse transcriptase n=1 Tax=Stichopus japonicus TaxID=307972 RepID=A0A2G8K0V6_STIJA|nr:reverse transcriptase [Apostichopus japonicus]